MTIKVGFDYDEPIFKWYANAHQVSVAAGLAKPSDPPPTSWDPHSHYGCTLEEWIAVIDAEVDKGYDGMYGKPVDTEAVTAIRRLYRLGYEVHLVTARGSFGSKGDKIRRLTKAQVVRERIPHNGLHFAPDKTKIIRDLGLHYFIDDRAKHFEEAAAAGADTFLLDATWNQDFEVPQGRRVYSTGEFVDRILKTHGGLRELTDNQRNHLNLESV